MARPRSRPFAPALLLAAALGLVSAGARAQGGPPMITDDPGTAPIGHWEINLGNIGTRTRDGWLVALPDADLNYGWSERLQLKFDTPWNLREAPADPAQGGRPWTSGLGTTNLGAKWRFLDDEESGWAISTYPQLGLNLDPASAGRGVASADRTLYLPVQSAGRLGPLDLDVEAGRLLVQHASAGWAVGAAVGHGLAEGIEGLLETRYRTGGGNAAALINLGGRWELTKECSLMGALGHEFGTSGPDRAILLYYLGVQIRP